MSSNLEDQQANRVRYYGLQHGTVTSTEDPKGLHRVQANIPGIAEPSTDWLYPLTIGGGSPQRGGHVVPAVGSDVCIWFHQGDPNGAGHYAAGNWGIPAEGDGTAETPGDTKDAIADKPEQVQSLEIDGLRITVDERKGSRALQILDLDEKGNVQCAIVLDREQRGILLKAVSQIRLECNGSVTIDALECNILDRRVGFSPAPI